MSGTWADPLATWADPLVTWTGDLAALVPDEPGAVDLVNFLPGVCTERPGGVRTVTCREKVGGTRTVPTGCHPRHR